MNKKVLILCLLIVSLIVGGYVFRSKYSQREFNINKFIKEEYKYCREEPVFCNNLVRVDCGAAVDGPLYYLNKETGEQVSICGGACMLPKGYQIEVCKTLCPPKEWNCK